MKFFISLFIISTLTLSVFAQQDISLKVGNIDGESIVNPGLGYIDVYAYSSGAMQSGTMHTGAGGTAGKVNFQDYVFTICLDKSLNPMKIALAKGTIFAKVTAQFNKAGNPRIKTMEVKLENVIISSIIEGATGDTDKITFNVSFNYGKITCSYFDKNGVKDPNEFKWDVAGNTTF